jgi:ribosomal protein S18 acetylase RimI-like enzyme
MSSSIQPPLQILRVPPEDRQPALDLVFRHMAPAERRQQLAMLGGAWDGLFAAYRNGRLVGAVLGQPQPGSLAALWPPQLIDDEPSPCALRLLAAVDRYLGEQGVQIAQALLGAADAADAGVLLQGGFVHLADLVYLVSTSEHFPAIEPETVLQFQAWTPAAQERLAAVVEASYAETLDCPAMNGVRRVEDVLAGYRATGELDAGRWWIVRHDGQDVGCLLLADFPQQDAWELVYMGIVPAVRGRGWGRQIVRRAQWLAGQAGRARLVLAVDAANAPALAMYAAAGFRAFECRAVFLKRYR